MSVETEQALQGSGRFAVGDEAGKDVHEQITDRSEASCTSSTVSERVKCFELVWFQF